MRRQRVGLDPSSSPGVDLTFLQNALTTGEANAEANTDSLVPAASATAVHHPVSVQSHAKAGSMQGTATAKAACPNSQLSAST